MKHVIDGEIVLSRPLEGPLAGQIPAFAQWVREQGYARYSRYRHVLLAACFSHWLTQQAVALRHIRFDHVSRFFASSHSTRAGWPG